MLKLVIVDDEYEIVNGLKNYIPWSLLGYEPAESFTDSCQALSYILQNSIDVVLTDIMMPELSGLELCREILESKPETRCIIISGYKDFNYARECMELGIRDYIVKPTKFEELKRVFSRIANELQTKELIENAEQTPVTKAKQFIIDNIGSATLESTAEHVGLNPYYLSTLFHQLTGIKFYDFVFARKMDTAKEMLEGSQLPIQDISVKVGYSNPNSFTRAFKSSFGVNPKMYRRNLSKEYDAN
jgi:Response regulator containing CheY-like receiver domain and AraC-type DNA-binding domain